MLPVIKTAGMLVDTVQIYCGVVVHCGDCGSSNSDITEPCSPLSTTSLEEMPPTQSQPAWIWGGTEAGDPPSKRPKQGKITEYFKTKAKKVSEKPASTVKQLISKLLASPPATPKAGSLPYDSTEVFRDSLTPTADNKPLTPPTTSPETSSDTSLLSGSKSEVENGDISFLFKKTDVEDKDKESEEKAERTIRFPVKNVWRGHYVSDYVCKWTDCDAKFATATALSEHLVIIHVNPQIGNNYVCKWVNCKVFGRTSCSFNWLERHVLSHGGNKRFRCIVDECGQRFSSQSLLHRHVDSHFNENKDQGSSKKGCETATKLIRRNGKKLRYRSHPFSARIYDYFDAGIMEGLQHNLIEMTERRTNGHFDSCPGDTVTLHSKILGKRTDEKGQTQVLLRWFPRDILSDEWVSSTKAERVRYVNIPALPSESKDCLYSYLTSNQRLRRSHGRKYKPSSTASST